MVCLSWSPLASAAVISLVLCTSVKAVDDDKKESGKYEVTTSSYTKRRQCIQEIKIIGNGVKETFRGPCKKDINIINDNDVLIIGDLDTAPFCMYADKPNTLMTLKDGQCKQRSYTSAKGKTTSKIEVMNDKDCEELEKTVKQELKKILSKGVGADDTKYSVSTSNAYTRRGCFQDIKVEGNGVEDIFRRPCADEELNVINSDGLLVIGDLKVAPFCLFADKPSTLVVLQDGECEQKSYTTENGKIVRTEKVLDDKECNEIEGKIKKELAKDKRSKGFSTPANSLYHVDMMGKTTNGECVQEISINGNGVDDLFSEPCDDDFDVKRSEDVLIVGEPNVTPYCFFSDKRQTLYILRNGECEEKLYNTDKGKTTRTSRVMATEDCQEVEAKIEKLLKKN